jgi:branched-chain amino acid transport system permease protein
MRLSLGLRGARWPRGRMTTGLDAIGICLLIGIAVSALATGPTIAEWVVCAGYVLFAVSTNIVVGKSGILTFGQAAYFGSGAYAVALLSGRHFPTELLFVFVFVIGCVMAAVYGLIVPTRSRFLTAVLTLVFAQFLYLLLFDIPALGAENGLTVGVQEPFFGISLESENNLWWFSVIVAGLSLFVLRRMDRSSAGLTWAAVRDDEIRAAALGLSSRWARFAALVYAGGFSAVAGAIVVEGQLVAAPELLYWTQSGAVLIMILLGGIRNFWGPAVGAVAYTWLTYEFTLHFSSGDPDLFIGLILLVVVLLRPQGLLGALPRLPVIGHRRGAALPAQAEAVDAEPAWPVSEQEAPQ